MYDNPESKMRFGLDDHSEEIRNLRLAIKDDKRKARNLRARINRQARDEAYQSCGMVKVRGALGGTYWE